MSHGAPATIGRYELHEQLAQGGMATVHVGRLRGAHGFAKTVAIKRLHPHLADDPEFKETLLDEARMASRVRHANVAAITDVIALEHELIIVMEYVEGESLASLLKTLVEKGTSMPLPIACRIMVDALDGLHAAHEATSEQGEPLQLVHRDVSPQNILVGLDGVARVIDFGVARAAGRLRTTEGDEIKGKLAYMAPEQVRGQALDRRVDVFAAGIVLWELCTRERLFSGSRDELVFRVLEQPIVAPSSKNPGVLPELDRVVAKALSRNAEGRYPTTHEFAEALERALPPAPAREVAAWVRNTAAESLSRRAELVARAGRSAPAEVTEAAPAAAVRPVAASSVALAAPVRAEEPEPRRRLGVGVGVLAAIVIVTLTGVLASSRRKAPAEPPVPPAGSALPPTQDSAATVAPLGTPVEPRVEASTAPAAALDAGARPAATHTPPSKPQERPIPRKSLYTQD